MYLTESIKDYKTLATFILNLNIFIITTNMSIRMPRKKAKFLKELGVLVPAYLPTPMMRNADIYYVYKNYRYYFKYVKRQN